MSQATPRGTCLQLKKSSSDVSVFDVVLAHIKRYQNTKISANFYTWTSNSNYNYESLQLHSFSNLLTKDWVHLYCTLSDKLMLSSFQKVRGTPVTLPRFSCFCCTLFFACITRVLPPVIAANTSSYSRNITSRRR